MSIRMALCGLVAGALLAPAAISDMGRVYVDTTGVKVSESAQKAIILHNNQEEVLILGTELLGGRQTKIVRFIPFPSEPQVSLAPKDVFERLAAIVDKYRLQFVSVFHSKGGPPSTLMAGVEVRLSARLGAHDLTVIRVRDVKAFRSWVNVYFRKQGLPHRASYPKEEAVVADYVARGIDYFVLDAVTVPADKHFIDPVTYRFKSTSLYYPLKTSNTFGGKGDIELFILAPTTLCAPGSAVFTDEMDKAVNAQGMVAGDCLGLPVKASTSAMLVPEEHDLTALYAGAGAFFGRHPAYLQSIRYSGAYSFKDDILLPMPQGVARAMPAPRAEEMNAHIFAPLLPDLPAICRKKPDRGPCKGLFEAFFFDEQTGTCKPFTWGGCQGEVPFQTLMDCQKACTAAQH
jgi:hypothetical protein